MVLHDPGQDARAFVRDPYGADVPHQFGKRLANFRRDIVKHRRVKNDKARVAWRFDREGLGSAQKGARHHARRIAMRHRDRRIEPLAAFGLLGPN